MAGLAAASLLAACASGDPLASIAPPNPDVPKVAPDAFPTLGTTEAKGRPAPLNPAQRDQLQKELESLAKSRQDQVEKQLQTDG